MGNEMAQEVPQSMLQTGRRDTRFRPGVSGNPAGSADRQFRLQHRITELAVSFGGIAALAPDELELLRQAALLSTRRVADAEQAVRIANALRAIFEFLADRHHGKPRNLPNVAEEDIVGQALQRLGDRDG
jgi:hypothetical protein